MKIVGPKIDSHIIDGRVISKAINAETAKLIHERNVTPGLAVILVGEDPASHLYVNLKKKACLGAGIDFHSYLFDADHRQEQVVETIEFLNHDPDIHGILVQLPLPENFAADEIIKAIDPKKDVDGFHPDNIEATRNKKPTIISPLALGIDRMIQETKIDLHNKVITVLANNEILAEPFHYLYGTDNNVRMVKPDNKDCQALCHESDILIVAVGRPHFITNDFIKDNAVIIDVGINSVAGQTVGDVDFENALLKVSYISPVPGGVGPMTIAYLLRNLLELASSAKAQP
jgi:methylenetetrahydrofolate dehydrogenase (NADP+)/methenyltetrahydrofolate cyclohydrolase